MPRPRDLTSLLSFKTLPDASSPSVSSPQEALYYTLRPSIPPPQSYPRGLSILSLYDRSGFQSPGAFRNPRAPQFHTPTLPEPPTALSQFRMSEMNTASPRIPSPLDTAGMMAVVSVPGLAGQGRAQRSGGWQARTGRKGPQAGPRSRAGRGRAGCGRAGWQAAAPPPDPPSPPLSCALSRPLARTTAAQTREHPPSPLSLVNGQRRAATIGLAPRYFRS